MIEPLSDFHCKCRNIQAIVVNSCSSIFERNICVRRILKNIDFVPHVDRGSLFSAQVMSVWFSNATIRCVVFMYPKDLSTQAVRRFQTKLIIYIRCLHCITEYHWLFMMLGLLY
jgi:hypothetical protein